MVLVDDGKGLSHNAAGSIIHGNMILVDKMYNAKAAGTITRRKTRESDAPKNPKDGVKKTVLRRGMVNPRGLERAFCHIPGKVIDATDELEVLDGNPEDTVGD